MIEPILVAIYALIGMIAFYIAVRLFSAAWHRSKIEVEVERAIQAKPKQRKEQDNE